MASSDYDFDDKTVAEVTLSYQSYRGKIGRSLRILEAQMGLLHSSFSPVTSKSFRKELVKCERYLDILTSISVWMEVQKTEHAKDHKGEVAGFQESYEKVNEKFTVIVHARTQGAADQSIDSDDEVVPRSSAKPISELKPKELAYDAPASTVRDWKYRFRAYHSASNMGTLPISTQQAFLANTLAPDISMLNF